MIAATLVVVQMHGEPGSGKTTLAHALAAAVNAVVIEIDLITAALERVGVGTGERGQVVYNVHYSLAASLLAQGRSVILDNPVFRPEVEGLSLRVAQEAVAAWRMIECVCSRDERTRRLCGRPGGPMPDAGPPDWRAKQGTSEPRSPRLVLDTERPLADLIVQAMDFVST